MNLIEYANSHCQSLLQSQNSKSIFEMIEEHDDLPYDDIRPNDDGVLEKVVFIDNDRYISVFDLLSYSRADILAMNDQALLSVFDNYMETVEVENLDIFNILHLLQKYKNVKAQEEMDANGLLSPQW